MEMSPIHRSLGCVFAWLKRTLFRRPSPRIPMPAFVHTPECQAYQADLERRVETRQAWSTRWPKHCRACDGLGRWDDSDWSVGLHGWGDCESCTALGICPRCGEHQLVPDPENDSYVGPCSACGFNYSEGQGHEDDIPPVADMGLGCICPPSPGELPSMTEAEVAVLLTSQQDYDPLAWQEQNRAVLRSADR